MARGWKYAIDFVNSFNIFRIIFTIDIAPLKYN